MSLSNPYQAYQRQAVTTSRPEDLTLMLYEGIVKFVRLSKMALENKQFEVAYRNNINAQNILIELIVTLKQEFEVSEPLSKLYQYMKRQLIQANLSRDIDHLTEVEGFAVELVETWSTAMKKAKA